MSRLSFLQCVNKVLVRLRQKQVLSTTDREYSRLIAEFVNQAIKYVEDKSYWSDLRTNTTLSLVSGTQTYSLTGWGGRGRLDKVVITSDSISRLRIVSNESWDLLDQTIDNGKPDRFRLYTFDGSGDPRIQFYRMPDASYTAVVSGWVGQGDISVDSTTILVPWEPVILKAHAYAIQERGEDGGLSYAEAIDIAEDSLYRAIERDSEGQAGGQVPIWSIG